MTNYRSELDLLNASITISGVTVVYSSTLDAINAIADNSGSAPALRVTSVNGLAGSSGSSGTSGTSGSSGNTGSSGSSGTSGAAGTSGTDGIGSSGTSGTSGHDGVGSGTTFTGGTVSDLTVTGNLMTNTSTTYYVGSPTADGSWRFSVIANNLVFQNYTLSATTWVTRGTFLG